MQEFLQFLSYATPFITLGLGWWFTTKNKKREEEAARAEKARLAEEDARRQELVQLKRDIDNVNLRLQAFKKSANISGMDTKINRVVDINETVLSYSIILGKLAMSIAKGTKETAGLSMETKTEVTTNLAKFEDADRNLNSKILGSVFIKGGNES